MNSPFPGMDPYLEDPAIWMDFHERFITYCSDFLNDSLPDAATDLQSAYGLAQA